MVTTTDAGTRGTYPGYQFSFDWKKKDATCSSSCEDIFGAFLSSSVCSFDSHTKSASGSQETACGTASFKFSDGKPTSLEKLTCGNQTDMGNPIHFASLESMNEAIDSFCQLQGDNKLHFRSGKPAEFGNSRNLHWNDNKHDPIYLSMSYIDTPSCPSMDFSLPSTVNACKDRFKYIVNTCKYT